MTADPEGKRALFDPFPGDATERAIRPTIQTGRTGRRAVFSAAERQAGTVVLHCESCRGHTRIGLLDFAWRHLPFWLWIPGKRYSRLLRCPSCERTTWQHADFFA